MENTVVDPTSLTIRPICKKVAKQMIIKNHYTHKFSCCSVALGIFMKSDSFFNSEELVGCLVFGNPVGRSASTSISSTLKSVEVLELVRLWCKDGTGKNTESYSISKSFDWIKKNLPKIKCILSYADDEYHTGKIYQATNFLYLGRTSELNIMPNFSISLTKPYNWIHSRTVFQKYGSHNIEHLKTRIGKTFWRKKEASKFKYVYFLCSKKEKVEYLKNLKQSSKPYPKDNNFENQIEEIVVNESELKNEFFG